MDELNKEEVNIKITLSGWFHTLKWASRNFSVLWVTVINSVIVRQRWPCCTVPKVHSWSLCAASGISRVLVQWEMSCCPFTAGGVFGSSGITVLWWLTKKMCVIWALLLIQLHQLQEVCVRQGVLPACCLMSLLLRQIDWKLKYFFLLWLYWWSCLAQIRPEFVALRCSCPPCLFDNLI